MSPQLTIEPARSDDLAQIKAWAQTTHAEHGAAFPYMFSENELLLWPSLYDGAFPEGKKKAITNLIVARLGDVLVGYLLLPAATERAESITILDIFTRPENRRQGIGQAMLSYLAQQRDEADWDNIHAHVWSGNGASAALFEKASYTPILTRYRFGPNRRARSPQASGPAKKRALAPSDLALLACIVGFVLGRMF